MSPTHNDNSESSDPTTIAWSSQDTSTNPPIDPAALARSASDAHRRDQLRLLTVNVQEFLPPLLLAALFASNVGDAVRPLTVLVAALLVAAVSCFLVGSSIRHHRSDRRWGSSVQDQLAQRSAQLEHRVWMYRNLVFWYFLPIAAALGLFIYGVGDIPLGEGILIWALMVGILVPVYLFARRIGRSRYEDEAERFKSLLADFVEPTTISGL